MPRYPSRGARALAALATGVFSVLLAAAPAAADPPRPIGVLYNGAIPERGEPEAKPEPCHEDCFLLSSLSLKGAVAGTMTFELKGGVRADHLVKVPLFGPPGQVRLDDVTIDNAPAQIGFDGDRFHVFTADRAFTIRGRVTLGSDAILAVPGPIVSVDAALSSGKLIEGDRLSGVTGAVLHFDPMRDGTSKPKPPPVFRLARALRFGRETAFVYRLTAEQEDDLGTIRLPLRYGEKVADVQGSTGWTVEGNDLALPTTGHEAEITISGT